MNNVNWRQSWPPDEGTAPVSQCESYDPHIPAIGNGNFATRRIRLDKELAVSISNVLRQRGRLRSIEVRPVVQPLEWKTFWMLNRATG